MSDDELHRFTLRLPSDLLQKVNEAAENSKRSATAEIVARLERSFEQNSPHQGLIDDFNKIDPEWLPRALWIIANSTKKPS